MPREKRVASSRQFVAQHPKEILVTAAIGIALFGCATPPVEAGATEAVQCMADELKANARAFDIQFSHAYRRDRTSAKLGYGFRDPSGARHYTWKELIPYPSGGGYAYDGWIEYFEPLDPAHEVKTVWETKCRVSAALFLQ
jgi:hypothetical protein